MAGSDVLSRVLDGEAIVIDLRTGSYYAMPGAAAVAWHRLATGATIEEAVDAVARHFGIDANRVRADVAAFVWSLHDAGLVTDAEDGAHEAATEALGASQDSLPPAAGLDTYRPPRLETYTDLQDFLLVDPIHEVSEEGWPHPAAADDKGGSQ